MRSLVTSLEHPGCSRHITTLLISPPLLDEEGGDAAPLPGVLKPGRKETHLCRGPGNTPGSGTRHRAWLLLELMGPWSTSMAGLDWESVRFPAMLGFQLYLIWGLRGVGSLTQQGNLRWCTGHALP